MTAALALPNPTELDIPDDLVAQAELFAEASISRNTRRAYLAWCRAKALDPMQAVTTRPWLAHGNARLNNPTPVDLYATPSERVAACPRVAVDVGAKPLKTKYPRSTTQSAGSGRNRW